jgi:hypothetical protein
VSWTTQPEGNARITAWYDLRLSRNQLHGK